MRASASALLLASIPSCDIDPCDKAGRSCLLKMQQGDLLLEQAKKLRKLLQWAEMKCLMVEGEWQKRVA